MMRAKKWFRVKSVNEEISGIVLHFHSGTSRLLTQATVKLPKETTPRKYRSNDKISRL